MIRTKLLSVALVTVMALTVVAGVGVLGTTKGAAYIEAADWGAQLNSGSLRWASYQYAPFSPGLSLYTWDEDPAYAGYYTHDGHAVDFHLEPASSMPSEFYSYTSGPPKPILTLTTTVIGNGALTWWWNGGVTNTQGALVVDGKIVSVLTGEHNEATQVHYNVYDSANPTKTHTLSFQLQLLPRTVTMAAGDLLLDTVTWYGQAGATPPVTKNTVLTTVTGLATQLGDPATTSFKTPQAENAFVNKLNALSKLVDAGSYDAAQAKLQNDLMKYNAKWGTQAVGDRLTGISADLTVLQGHK